MAEREEELKSLLMKVKEGNEKAGFQTQCSKHEDHPLVITHLVLTSWQIDGETMETVKTKKHFLGLQNQCRR